jgi:hypothetical protein
VAGWVRLGGRGTLGDGSRVVWSVAEGRRGRRWREVRTAADGAVISSLLLETDAVGRFSHTEISTAAGLLTLHPEADGTLHGNVVTGGGVLHVRGVPWHPDGAVLLLDSPVATAVAAATAHRLAGPLPRVVFIEPESLRFLQDADVERAWEGVIDAEGLPILPASATWPLEE